MAASTKEGSVVYVHCSECNGDFYVHRADYEKHPEAFCHCPFCHHEFDFVRAENVKHG